MAESSFMLCMLEVWHALSEDFYIGLQDGTQKSQKVFVNIPTEVGATEAEEIGKCRLLQRRMHLCIGHLMPLNTSQPSRQSVQQERDHTTLP